MTETSDLTAFIAARLDEDEAIAKAAAEPGVSQNGEWIAYGHPPGVRDGRKDRDVQLVGAGPDEASWTVCEVGQWDRAAMVGAHIARHDPDRERREVAFKRALLEWHYPGFPPPGAPEGLKICAGEEGDCDTWQMAVPWPCPQIRALAAIWSDRPDYDPDWALDGAETREAGPTP